MEEGGNLASGSDCPGWALGLQPPWGPASQGRVSGVGTEGRCYGPFLHARRWAWLLAQALASWPSEIQPLLAPPFLPLSLTFSPQAQHQG